LWEKVTISLRTDDIDSATESKRSLEDKQRQDAKQRLESGVVYKPKVRGRVCAALSGFLVRL